MSETLDPSAQHLAVLKQAFDSLGTGLQGGNTATIVVQGGANILSLSIFINFKVQRSVSTLTSCSSILLFSAPC